MRSSSLIGVLVLLAGCSSAPANQPDDIITSHADLCAGAAPETSDHLVTAISCPFVQHTSNIERFGEVLPQKAELLDASGVKVATIAATCDSWALGTDAEGLTVVVRLDSGKVFSHGTKEPGQSLSRLPPTLSLPVRLH